MIKLRAHLRRMFAGLLFIRQDTSNAVDYCCLRGWIEHKDVARVHIESMSLIHAWILDVEPCSAPEAEQNYYAPIIAVIYVGWEATSNARILPNAAVSDCRNGH